MTILRYWFLGLAILIVAIVGWRSAAVMRPDGDASGTPPTIEASQAPKTALQTPDAALDAARQGIVRRLDEVPQFSAFHKELAAHFPRLHDDLVAHAAQAVAGGGAPPTPATLLWDALRGLQQSSGILAANADEAALATFFDARLSLLDVLATADVRTCADFLYGSTDPAIEDFSAAHRDLVAEMAMKQLAVIEDGQRKHLEPGAPSAADLDLVAAGLANRKLSSDEVALLLDGKPIDPPLPDARLCDLGRTYLAVLKELPPVVRQRVYGLAAELLARS